MKIGVKLPNSGPFASADRIRTVALEAERLGYDSLWVHDHITRSAADAKNHFVAGSVEAWQPPILPNVFEAMSTLLFVAGITKRVELGTSVIVLPLRNPVVLAKEAACLDQLSGGRLVLGVGLGGDLYAREELGAIGALHLMGKRGRVADEWIEIMRAVWQLPSVTIHGKFIDIVEAEVFPKPVRAGGLPIWYGGSTEHALRHTGQHADGWLPMFQLPDELVEGRRRIEEIAQDAGRDPSPLQVASEHWLSISTDRTKAETFATSTIEGLADYVDALRGTRTGRERYGRLDRSLVGDPDSILRQVRAYQAAGVDHIILRVIAHNFDEMIESLELFRREIMDRLDRRAAVD